MNLSKSFANPTTSCANPEQIPAESNATPIQISHESKSYANPKRILLQMICKSFQSPVQILANPMLMLVNI